MMTVPNIVCWFGIHHKRKITVRTLDGIFLNALKWPMTKNNKLRSRDKNEFIKNMLNLWNKNRYFYTPSFPVWKQYIMMASESTNEDVTSWLPVIAAYEKLLDRYHEQFFVDHWLLQRGLEVSRISNRSDLAARLIAKYIEDELYKLSTNDDYLIQIPVLDLLKVFDRCTSSCDVDSSRVILSSIDTIREHVLPTNLRLLCVAGLNTFAKAGAFELADKLLSYMRDKDLKPA
jgi:hypothetical protein